MLSNIAGSVLNFWLWTILVMFCFAGGGGGVKPQFCSGLGTNGVLSPPPNIVGTLFVSASALTEKSNCEFCDIYCFFCFSSCLFFLLWMTTPQKTESSKSKTQIGATNQYPNKQWIYCASCDKRQNTEKHSNSWNKSQQTHETRKLTKQIFKTLEPALRLKASRIAVKTVFL